METLRAELIESQKVRSDLLKWKLLIIAGVGGASLGFSGAGGGANGHFALAVLPFACGYVDLLCRHLSLRNQAIGLFLKYSRHQSPVLAEYEAFYAELKATAWPGPLLEAYALRASTVAVSLMVLPIGILFGDSGWHPLRWPSGLFYSATLLGLAFSWWVESQYEQRSRRAAEQSAAISAMVGDERPKQGRE